MIDSCLPRLVEAVYGKSLPAVLEDLTGVSAKTWTKPGGPKRPRTLEKANRNATTLGLSRLCAEGWSDEEAQRILEYVVGSPDSGFGFALLVRVSSLPGKFEYPIALGMAERMDLFSQELRALRLRNDFKGFRQALLDSAYWKDVRSWITVACDAASYASLSSSTKTARTWKMIDPAVNAISVLAIYQLLAMWELEFQSAFFTEQRTHRGLSPLPLVGLLMPTTKFGFDRTPYGTFPEPHGLLHLPLRRLLYLCYCFSELHKNGKWPPKNLVTRDFVAGASRVLSGDDYSPQRIASISRGTRGFTCQEFMRVWCEMCDFDKIGHVQEHERAEGAADRVQEGHAENVKATALYAHRRARSHPGRCPACRGATDRRASVLPGRVCAPH